MMDKTRSFNILAGIQSAGMPSFAAFAPVGKGHGGKLVHEVVKFS
jgi:hypothetical protein